MTNDLVLFNMSCESDWHRGVVNRNYFVARELAASQKIGKILFVHILPHTFKRAVRIWWEDIQQQKDRNTLTRGALWTLTKGESAERFSLSTVEPIVSESRFLGTLQRLLGSLGFQNTILWSYLPTYVGAFLSHSWATKVFDAVDDWGTHPSYKKLRGRIENNYHVIAQHADHVFTVSKELMEKFDDHPSVHWIPNGVDIERFSSPLASPYPADQTVRIVYVGVIQGRFDADILSYIASRRPTYHFYLIGPIWPDAHLEALKRISNVHYLGFLPSNQIPPYLFNATVGIVPHRNNSLVASMNPMKIYEYLAAGLPVVSTPVNGFSGFNGVSIAATAEAFLSSVDAAVTRPPSRELLHASMQQHTWSSRVSAMWAVLQGHGAS